MIKELREKKKDELLKLLEEARSELVKLRLERKTGSLADGSAIRKKRKEAARILTVLGEKEILKEAEKIVEEPKEEKAVKEKSKKSKGK